MADQPSDRSSLDRSFTAAVKAAAAAPASDDAWDHLEDLADTLGRTDDVAEEYRDALERSLAPEVFRPVAERAVRYHEEWFGDAPERITSLLERICALHPQSDWAFERLVMNLTTHGRWDELLEAYDRAVAAAEPERRKQLLDDAAQAAKDFADRPDRAADYLQLLLALDPDNGVLVQSLERLLERGKRHRDLVALWEGRLEHQSPSVRTETRLRMATVWLDELDAPARALETLRALLEEAPGHADAGRLLERVLERPSADGDVRGQAVSLLRKNYLIAERPEEVVRVLERALPAIDPEERPRLHRELGSRLSILGREKEAFDHYRALVLADPTDADARRQLRRLAARTEQERRHAATLVEAAEASPDASTRAAVLLDAARLHQEALDDVEGALAHYRSVLEANADEPRFARAAAHALDDLLAEAGRDEERLTVLETLAPLERSGRARRAVLAEAARLADRQGDVDRALRNWQPVLELAPDDREALDAVVDLLGRHERWAEYVDALQRRSDAAGPGLQQRADQVRIAEVQHREMGDPVAATDRWLRIRETFGDAQDVVEALDALMTAAGREEEFAQILSEGATQGRAQHVARLRRLGGIYREALQQPQAAVTWLSAALDIAPADEDTRTEMRALLATEEVAHDAAEALARAYRATNDDTLLLDTLEPRLTAARDQAEQGALLRDAARVHLDHRDDPAAALACLCRALPLEPDNLAVEGRIMRLAEHGGDWDAAADSLRRASEAAVTTPARAAELRRAEGAIRWRLEQVEAALDAYRAAVELVPDDAPTVDRLARVAARADEWTAAAEAALRAVALRDRLPPALLDQLETEAHGREGGLRALAVALEEGLDHRPEDDTSAPTVAPPLAAPLAGAILERVAQWYQGRLGDVEAAERLATRAVHLAPHEANLRLLAELRRQLDHPELRFTLLALDERQPRSLDALQEAARLSLQPRDDGSPPATDRHAVVERLYRKAASMWIRNDATTGTLEPASVAQWALERLVALHVEDARPAEAVDVLLDATRLPLEAGHTVALRRRAAEMLTEHGQGNRAIDVYRRVLDAEPNDVEVLQRMAQLCEAEGRISEALGLRLREVALVDDEDRRLALRLEHARLTGALEAKGDRVSSLLANLRDRPGHRPSVDQLRSVLVARGKELQLADILTEQATALDGQGAARDAAALWADVARIAEEHDDLPRAVDALQRVVALDPSPEALDALARLHLAEGQPSEAARGLERRLSLSEPSDRVAVLLQLARARRKAEDREGARQALREAFEEAPRNAEARKELFDLYRKSHDWVALADALSRAAEVVNDDRTVLAYAEEASRLYRERLDDPAGAVPVLRRAVEVAPDDRELKLGLAEGLAAEGAFDEARGLFTALVADFGRRRSPARARIHLALAGVLRAQGENEAALEALDAASKMAPGDAEILMNLAELASDSEHLEQAERAYRSLLLTVRRGPARDLPIGPAEVLFQLAHLATRGGRDDKASELVESGLEALVQHDHEAARIGDKLRSRGDFSLLERVLRHRLEHVDVAHVRAAVLGELGTLLETHLERPDEGVELHLAAVHADPSSPLHHQAARDAAHRRDQLDAYVSQVEALLADERADRNPLVRCELLLRLGEVLEKERHDLDRAVTLYRQADATGVRTVDVWRAQARVAGAQGDSAEQMRLLAQLANLGEAEAETRTDALYRLAEVQLATRETLGEGVATLRRALAEDFRGERAAMILRRAVDRFGGEKDDHDDDGLLEVYEWVARRCGDDDTLLDFLTSRLERSDATIAYAREAVDIAIRLERFELAEQAMLRAVDLGRQGARADDLAAVDWALLGLAERRIQAGDLPAAVRWLIDAADVADPAAVFERAGHVLRLAQRPEGDLVLAAKLYERLLERAPNERAVWRPLAELYGALGDRQGLERLVEETLDGLADAEDRHGLRVILARSLLAEASRHEDAEGLLRQVLEDAPDHDEARGLLMDHLEATGQREAVHDLLRSQLRAARRDGDGAVLKTLSIELSRRLDEEHPDDAIAVLRDALEARPDDVDLLRALLQRLDEDALGERAQLLEALLRDVPPDEVPEHALALVALYDRLEDDGGGALRTLEEAVERAPADGGLRQALLQRYGAAGDAEGEVRVLLLSALQAPEDLARVPLWRRAAKVRRERLDDAAGAADLLERSVAAVPDDFGVRAELAGALSAAGAHARAVATISEVMSDPSETTLPLWLTRAQLRQAGGDEEGAVADLEQIFEIDRAVVAPLLVAALARRIQAAAETGDTPAEREATLRYVAVQQAAGAADEAIAQLDAFCGRHPEDVAPLRTLRALSADRGQWERVAETCARLLAVEEGEAQADAAMGLSHAHLELGTPAQARPGLERVAEAQPDREDIRNALRRIYEAEGDEPALAGLLVADARAASAPRDRAALLKRAGEIFLGLNRSKEAAETLEEALELTPGDASTTIALVDAYLQAGRLPEAGQRLDTAIEAGKGRRSADMARLFQRKAQLAAAENDVARELELLGEAHLCNKKNGEVAAALANLAEAMGNWDLAARTLRTITLIDDETCPISRGEAYLRQGRIALRQGDEKTARMWARRAKREAPEDPDVDAFLNELGDRPSLAPRR
ncbi:MAG: tetratricopeptide repeat protein [Myxococcota bacterium]